MRGLILFFLIISSLPYSILKAQLNTDSLERKADYNKSRKKKKNESSDVIWTDVVEDNDTFEDQIIWEKFEDNEQLDLKKYNGYTFNESHKNIRKEAIQSYDYIYNHMIELPLLNLGRSVPTANIVNEGDLQIKFTQISPLSKAYYGGGTGNQNYSVSINYGLTDSLMIEGFYSHSDDPLHKNINKYIGPVSNRWISYGTSLTWQFIRNNDLLVALNSSIENWNVKSGGCNLFNCTYSTNNIFTSNKEEVMNDNLVSSISLPITYKITNKLDFNLVPRAIFLPSNQSKGSTLGDFYGNSFGLGTGIEYKFLKNLKSYSSLYFPLSAGYNSFDENLIFERKTIYNAGLVYSLDTKIALEAGVSNGFGLSPSIATLTLPSSDELLYKASLIYRPNNLELPLKKTNKINRVRLEGLSVSTAESLGSGKIYSNYYLNNNGSWASKIIWGVSNRFDFDFSVSSIGQNSHSDKPFDRKYHDLDKLFVRAGGKAVFLSQGNGDLITTAARLSAGRLRGNGWLFTELINTYNINDNLSLNLNPKFSFSGIASPAGIGTSLNWQILQDISLIPEYNFSLKESTNNWTIALRFSKFKNINFDIFTTNSLNFIDTGQLQRSDSNSYGINVGFMF